MHHGSSPMEVKRPIIVNNSSSSSTTFAKGTDNLVRITCSTTRSTSSAEQLDHGLTHLFWFETPSSSVPLPAISSISSTSLSPTSSRVEPPSWQDPPSSTSSTSIRPNNYDLCIFCEQIIRPSLRVVLLIFLPFLIITPSSID